MAVPSFSKPTVFPFQESAMGEGTTRVTRFERERDSCTNPSPLDGGQRDFLEYPSQEEQGSIHDV